MSVEAKGDALVCRGGTCTARRFIEGTGVLLDDNGQLQGVSVNSRAGADATELCSTIPNRQVGIALLVDIETAGGIVATSPTPNNPYHCTLGGLTSQKAEELFTPTVANPNIP